MGIRRLIELGGVDTSVDYSHHASHIRPSGVRPLNHPERVQKAWGFSFSGVAYDATFSDSPIWVSIRMLKAFGSTMSIVSSITTLHRMTGSLTIPF